MEKSEACKAQNQHVEAGQGQGSTAKAPRALPEKKKGGSTIFHLSTFQLVRNIEWGYHDHASKALMRILGKNESLRFFQQLAGCLGYEDKFESNPCICGKRVPPKKTWGIPSIHSGGRQGVCL